MEITPFEISARGKPVTVPSVCICGRNVITTGNWLKIASIHDEMFIEREAVGDPDLFVAMIARAKLDADMFTFAQKQTEGKRKHRYYFEWDSAAIIQITSVADWEKRVERDV